MSETIDPFFYSLIIPAYNEMGRIDIFFKTLEKINGEIIVVCDGTDGTANFIKTFSNENPNLKMKCLIYSGRIGKGAAIIAGIKESQGDRIGYCDADGSVSFKEMDRLFSYLDNSDVVIGSRWVKGSVLEPPQNTLRRLESRVLNIIIRLLFGLKIKDTQCGAKVLRRTVINSVLPDFISNGFEFDIELLWRLKINNYQILEVPIHWQNKSDSKVRILDIYTIILGILRIRVKNLAPF